MTIDASIAAQIEDAYDFRGHVTVTLADGRAIEGFLFNRELTPMKGEPYVEILRKDSEERVRVPAAAVKSIAKTGKDFAVPFVPPAR